MSNRYNIISLLFASLFIIFNNIDGFAQCKSFTKKTCIPTLGDYVHNGQLNSIMLYPSESATINQTFYSGQNYRITVCTDKSTIENNAYFVVYDSKKKMVYNGEGKETTWDFNVQSTQDLIIEVKVPKHTNRSKPATEGCVSLLVGFK